MSITRCGEVESSPGVLREPDGPNGERCQREDGHIGPHTDATHKYTGTSYWTAEGALAGDCEQDCQTACAYPGQFSECAQGAVER